MSVTEWGNLLHDIEKILMVTDGGTLRLERSCSVDTARDTKTQKYFLHFMRARSVMLFARWVCDTRFLKAKFMRKQLIRCSRLNQGGCVSHRFTMLLLLFDSSASSLRMLEKLGNAERLEYVINVYNIYVTFLFLNGGFFLIYLRQNKRSAFLWYLGLVSSLHSWPSNVCSYSLMKWLIILLLYLQCMIGVSHSYYSPSYYVLPALLW